MPGLPPEVMRVDYVSAADGMSDWALLETPAKGDIWVVFIHGYGSTGDQLYTHAKLRKKWLPRFRAAGLGIVSVNLRGNVWVAPPTADDLHDLLNWLRKKHKACRFMFFSGSMGGTSNLIYATLYPDDCAAVAALGASTDMAAHYACDIKFEKGTIQREIGEAIAKAYGGTPEERPALYRRNSPLFNADRLTMPLYLAHGEKDALLPVDEMRALAAKLSTKSNVTYVEIPGGDHDSPCFYVPAMEWLLEKAEAFRS